MTSEGTRKLRDQEAEPLRARLRGALPAALKARDRVAVAALRSALAAIENAEAVDSARAPQAPEGHPTFAGTVAGVGATEVERRLLTPGEVADIVRAEMTEREAAARDYELRGRGDHAERLRTEAAVLAAHLDAMGPPGASPGDRAGTPPGASG